MLQNMRRRLLYLFHSWRSKWTPQASCSAESTAYTDMCFVGLSFWACPAKDESRCRVECRPASAQLHTFRTLLVRSGAFPFIAIAPSLARSLSSPLSTRVSQWANVFFFSALLHRPCKAAGYAVPTATAALRGLLHCVACVARLKRRKH